MIKITVVKSKLEDQLLPLIYKELMVYSFSLGGTSGLFGFQRNQIVFIPEESIPEELEIEYPEHMQDIKSFLISAEYLLHRIMMAPNLNIIGYKGEIPVDDLVIEISKMFSFFIEKYSNRVTEIERYKCQI